MQFSLRPEICREESRERSYFVSLQVNVIWIVFSDPALVKELLSIILLRHCCLRQIITHIYNDPSVHLYVGSSVLWHLKNPFRPEEVCRKFRGRGFVVSYNSCQIKITSYLEMLLSSHTTNNYLTQSQSDLKFVSLMGPNTPHENIVICNDVMTLSFFAQYNLRAPTSPLFLSPLALLKN